MRTKLFFLLTALLAGIGSVQAQNWQETQLLLPEANSEMHFLGAVVSIDGDYAVAGADEFSVGNGYALVYQRTGENWKKVAKLTLSNPITLGVFGQSVDISDDVVIVATAVNCVYIFEKPASGWADMTETAKLTASDGTTDDNFGASVNISGNTAIIGAFSDDDNGENSGSAYIFQKPANGWADMTETAKLTASDGAAEDWFGRSVSISGDVAIVGAFGDNDNGDDSGSAYIFQKPASGWENMSQTGKLQPLDGAENKRFGRSVSISGDVAIVGAYGDNDNLSNSGSAYIFEKPTNGWEDMTETAKLTASDGTENDKFGISVSISGNTAIVGAYTDTDNGSNSGSAYIFEKSGTNWTTMTETEKLKPDDGAENDKFGISVSISGNYAIIGADGNDDNGNYSGSAYIFKNTAAGLDAFRTNDISVYPNPAKKFINIEYSQNNIQKLRITDISGKEMLSKTKPQQKEQINLSGFARGIYIIHIQTADKIFTRKIIKE